MFEKLISDLRAPANRYQLAADIHNQKLGYYYFMFDEQRVAAGKDQKLISKFDADGIPINKTYIDVSDKDYVYFPISIGQMGLAVFHTYLKSGSETDKARFIKFADWFRNNAVNDDKLGSRWMTNVSLPQYKNPGPWQSAFAQSRAISILIRAYQITTDQKYLAQAEQGLKPFSVPVSEGGVTSFTSFGPFYEEYTAQVPTLVLNGMIFSICGLYDFVRMQREHSLANKLYQDGIETLKSILGEYDMGYWSKYNRCEADWYPAVDPSTLLYQRLHVTQLELLYKMTGESVFFDYSRIFKDQVNLTNLMKMYLNKYKALKVLNRL
jgi:hypothetical protein